MNKSSRKKNLRILAAVLCVCIAVFLLLPFAYQIKEAGHACVGQGCLICAHIQNIKSSRQQLSLALVTSGAFIALSIRTMMTVLSDVMHFCISSPVRLKVKLNN